MSLCMIRCIRHRYVRPPKTASAILPNTSTRTGPKFFEMESRDLEKDCEHLVDHRASSIPSIHVLHAHNNIAGFIEKSAKE
jgi:hypothetical protein